MDLKGILNDGPSVHDGRRSTDEQNTRSAQSSVSGQPPPPPPIITGSQPPTPSSYGHHIHHQQTPAYSPASASPWANAYGQHPTPGKAPSQVPGPFPPQHIQSAAGAPPYRAYEPTSAATPVGRPSSRGHLFSAASTSQLPPASTLQARTNSSVSPTPPSSHSPFASRPSPQSARSQGPGQSLPQYQHPQLQPQPSTPLGPPTFHRQASNLQEAQSPFSPRNNLAASNGNASVSPAAAPYPPGSAAYFESPAAYHRPQSQQRQSHEYPSRVSRERSESVSPKTQVPRRIPSRQSSGHESHSRGASLASNVSSMVPDPQRHVMQPAQAQYDGGAQQQQQHSLFETHPHLASEVSQKAPLTVAATPKSLPSASASETSLLSQAQRPPLIHHQNSKMGMSHLLTPASEVPPTVNGSSGFDTASRASSKNLSEAGIQPSPRESQSVTPLQAMRQDAWPGSRSNEQSKAPDSTPQRPSLPGSQPTTDTRAALKRSADSEASEAPPPKQRRMRKYTQRPIWARLSKHNPNFSKQSAQIAGAPAPGPSQSNVGQSNGVSEENATVLEDRPPWTLNPPLDHDLINAQRVLGKWEKTFKWNTPYPDTLRAVQDWLYHELDQLGDVARDPHEGTVEIEAKFGRLMREDERYQLPVMNACVIHPQANNRLHFESSMTVLEHKHMNQFLNTSLQNTLKPGRVPMGYRHIYEVDSFHHLSALGQSVLPKSIQKRQGTRPPRLRITRDNKDGSHRVTARIVKIPISNLHIFNPGHNYDCRISINLEVNLDRPDLDLDSLIAADTDAQQGREVDRVKDRIAYKHLAYSIDLTKVERQGLEPSHELELEVDSNTLREQMSLMREGKPHAFGDVVAGFLDNATFLMRTRPPPGS